MSWVVDIGGAGIDIVTGGAGMEKLFSSAEDSLVRCPDKEATRKIIARIDRAKANGDSLGGTFQVVATGVPPGLGSHVQWDRKLNASLAAALMSIQAIKGVGVGEGFKAARLKGSELHDEIFYRSRNARRRGRPMPSGRRNADITERQIEPEVSRAAPPTESRSFLAPP